MDAQILQKCFLDITNKRITGEVFCAENYKKALKISQFCKINTLLNGLEIELGKAMFLKKDTAALKKQRQELQQQQQQILTKHGIGKIVYTPTCPACNDTGHNSNGEICKCVYKMYKDMIMQNTSTLLPHKSLLKNVKTDVFKTEIQQKYMEAIYKNLEQYVSAFPNNKKNNILFVGGAGSGKTFCCGLIANELIAKGRYVNYTTANNLNLKMQEYHSPYSSNRQNIISSFLEADVLIIDDLGTEPIYKNITIEYLYLIINERTLNGKHTIINTNLEPEQILANYGERLYSRMFDKNNTAIVQIRNTDIRQ